MGVINQYYKRHIEDIIKRSFENNKVVSILGARQVGKSTVVEYLFNNMNSVALKTEFLINQANQNPDSFLKSYSLPLFIDEIQNAPNLFGSIQDVVDKNNFYGQYILSGSNKLSIHDKIKESLSGRTSIIEMNGLSLREINNIEFKDYFIPTEEYITNRRKNIKSYGDIWFYIHRGSYPELYDNPNKDWEEFYSSYVQTYIEKDVLRNIKIKDISSFIKFLTACAARTGEMLNYENIANECDVSGNTVKEWISLLERTNIIYLLQPYFNSHLSRAVKTPKLYFRDTGLVCYLTGWLTKAQAEKGNKNGALYETFIVNEIIKSFSNRGKEYNKRLFYYHGKDKIKRQETKDNKTTISYLENEIDLIIEENGILYPIEIKKKDNPNKMDASAFDVLDKDIDKKRGLGVIISNNENLIYLRDNLIALPIEYI